MSRLPNRSHPHSHSSIIPRTSEEDITLRRLSIHTISAFIHVTLNDSRYKGKKSSEDIIELSFSLYRACIQAKEFNYIKTIENNYDKFLKEKENIAEIIFPDDE